MANIFTRLPKKGDIWARHRTTLEDVFIVRESFDSATFPSSVYEIIGGVAERNGDDVLVFNKTNASQKWLDRWTWKLTGFTLDGTDRSGVLSIREASDSWAANHDYTISYNASDKAGLVEQLNTYFGENLATQDWFARVEGEDILVSCDCIDYHQHSYNSGKTGFALAQFSAPEAVVLTNMIRKHGGTGGEGAISNWDRALAYYRTEHGSSTYEGARSSVQDSIKQTYPINLPTWLGTNTVNPGDWCAPLRAIYGEGEQGWLKFMASCLPVRPTDFGNMGQDFGAELGAILGARRYSTLTETDKAECPAAAYAYSITHDTIPAGFFHLPTVDELAAVLDGLKYGTSSSRNADPINDCLQKIGGTSISNSSPLWSCCRLSFYHAWSAYGGYGFFNGYYLYSSYGVVPVAHLKIRKANP